MRVTATVPGCEAWIEFTEFWSRNDFRRVTNLKDQEFLDFLATKAVAVHIDAVDGEPITTPADLSVAENFDRIDYRLVMFVGESIVHAADMAVKNAQKGPFCAPSSPASESQEQEPTAGS